MRFFFGIRSPTWDMRCLKQEYGLTLQRTKDSERGSKIPRIHIKVRKRICVHCTASERPTYRSGTNNADADGLSRKADVRTECTQFPEVLKAISSSFCRSSHYLATTVSPDVEQENPSEMLASTALKIKDWKRAQFVDQKLMKILEHLASDQRPTALHFEASGMDKRFLRKWARF